MENALQRLWEQSGEKKVHVCPNPGHGLKKVQFCVKSRKRRALIAFNQFECACERFKELVPEHITDFTRRTVRSPMQQMVQINELKANPFKSRICKIFSTSKLNNGSISFEDFLDMFSAFSEAAPVSVKADYAFRILDFNDNGAIDRLDLAQFLILITGNEIHKILNETEMKIIVDMIMEDIDMDGDESINISEFHHIASKMPDFASYFTMTVC